MCWLRSQKEANRRAHSTNGNILVAHVPYDPKLHGSIKQKARGWNRLQLGIFVHFCAWLDIDAVEAFDEWKSKITGKDPWASWTNKRNRGRHAMKTAFENVGPGSDFAATNLAFLTKLPEDFK